MFDMFLKKVGVLVGNFFVLGKVYIEVLILFF